MAFAVLLSLSKTIDQITSHDEYSISVNGKQKIASLSDHVIHLQKFIERSYEKANSLESRIRHAANEAEDIIEHFMYEQTRSGGGGVQYDFRELETVMDEIKSIAREAGSENWMVGVTPTMVSNLPIGPAVGLDDDLEKVRYFLCGGSLDRQILAITGMGGIGKTTLARNAYHDPLIKKCFDLRAWVTVSQDYNTEDLLASLLDSLQREEDEVCGNGRLTTAEKLHRIFDMRKYFIVLDDVWSEKACEDISMVVPRNVNGSRIVVTSRLENVGDNSFRPSHGMHLMNSSQSWRLLKQNIIFRNKECPPALEKIGKDIAKKCGGLPLAIVLAAGLLSTVDETQPAWEEVAKNLRRDIQKIEHFRRTMYLSYSHLPHRLRACFLYMAGFPDDYEIRVSKLIKMWIAEGFVTHDETYYRRRSLEEEGEVYLNDLVQRSLVKTYKSNGRIKCVGVHDMVRELYRRKAEEENFERRLSIAHPDLTCLARAYGSTLRSVISIRPNESSLSGLRKFRLLRLLDVVDTDAYSLPSSVFELFHLRFLAFGCPMEIPATISRLRNLRSLIIRPSKAFRQNSNNEMYLPLEIWSLPLLTDLVSFFDLLPNPEGTDSAMKKLLTLTVEKKLICTEEMMRRIPNVKKLGITYFGDKYKEDYQLHNLHLLQQLEKLTLIIKDNPADQVIKPNFPATLKKLTLSGWKLSWDDMKIVGELTNLQVLKLKDNACIGDTWTTEDGQFLALEHLLIDTSELENWETETDHFPELKRLELYRCSSLQQIPTDIGDINALEKIKVHHASRSLVVCVHGISEKQYKYSHKIYLDCEHYEGPRLDLKWVIQISQTTSIV